MGHQCCFNPRAPRGARRPSRSRCSGRFRFQSTRPARGATSKIDVARWFHWFQSTRPARGATQPQAARRLSAPFQSTRPARGATAHIYGSLTGELQFQSTRPARGATTRVSGRWVEKVCFNPRAPRGARHSLSDRLQAIFLFQSTRPARGATSVRRKSMWLITVSIHAPRAGRDVVFDGKGRVLLRVSIHAPRAGRDHWTFPKGGWEPGFQSTRPARGATESPAASLESACLFQSTRPARGATPSSPLKRVPHKVSIHAPRAGRDAPRAFLRG